MPNNIQAKLENCKPAAKVACLLFSNLACCAAFGAASGALGWAVNTSGGWTVAGIDQATFLQGMAFGGVQMGMPIACYNTDFILCTDTDQDCQHCLKRATLCQLLSGPCAGFFGGAMMNIPCSDQAVYFSSAAGATGYALLVIGAGLVCVLTNKITGNQYLCFKDQNQALSFVRYYTGTIELSDIFTPSQIGLQLQTPEQMLAAVHKMEMTPIKEEDEEEQMLTPTHKSTPAPRSPSPMYRDMAIV
jgi:hypothetical protein